MRPASSCSRRIQARSRACASSDRPRFAARFAAQALSRRRPAMSATLLHLVIAAIVAWLAIGVVGLLRPRNLRFVSRVLFPAGAAIAIGLSVVAGYAIGKVPQSTVLPLGLPDLPFH